MPSSVRSSPTPDRAHPRRRVPRKSAKKVPSARSGRAPPGESAEVASLESGFTKRTVNSVATRQTTTSMATKQTTNVAGGARKNGVAATEKRKTSLLDAFPAVESRSSEHSDDSSSKTSKTSKTSISSAASRILKDVRQVGRGKSRRDAEHEKGSDRDPALVGLTDEEAFDLLDCVVPSLSMVSKSDLGAKETQPLGGPKYYIATNTKEGKARVIHEAMPADMTKFQQAEEKGFEVLEYHLIKKCEEQPSSSRLALHRCEDSKLSASLGELDNLCRCEEDDNSIVESLTSALNSLPDRRGEDLLEGGCADTGDALGSGCAASRDALQSGCQDEPLGTGCALASAGGCAGLVMYVLLL